MKNHVSRLWEAQCGLCFHCSRPMLRVLPRQPNGLPENHGLKWSREHIYPRSKSHLTPENARHLIVLAHRKCNCNRGDLDPTEEQLERAWNIIERAAIQPSDVTSGRRRKRSHPGHRAHKQIAAVGHSVQLGDFNQ